MGPNSGTGKWPGLSDPAHRHPAELRDLDRRECLRLVAAQVIGRVLFTDAAMPAAQPVNFLLVGEEVLFRTASGIKLAAAERHGVLGFEVDHSDLDTATGWSVLGLGRSYEVTDLARLAELTTRLPEPWAPGQTAHTIAIPLQRLTGRALRAVSGIA